MGLYKALYIYNYDALETPRSSGNARG